MGLVAGLFALLAGGPVANAAILTTAPETESFTLTAPQVTYTRTSDGTPPVDFVTNTPQSDSEALIFNQFNGGLGTLIGVTITFSTIYGATVTVTVASNGDNTASVDFFSDADVSHSLTNASLIDPQSSPQSFSATCTAAFEAGCGPATQPDNGVNFNTPPGGVLLAAPFSSFVGGGTYALTATLTSGLTPRIEDPDNGTGMGDNSTYSGTLNAMWNGNVSVVYTYETAETSVPVPLSLYLLVTGLGGIALSRRYRR